jgi:hypothetical protein
MELRGLLSPFLSVKKPVHRKEKKKRSGGGECDAQLIAICLHRVLTFYGTSILFVFGG